MSDRQLPASAALRSRHPDGQDRWQVRNLADDQQHAKALKQHRARLQRWVKDTGDMGPESPEVYAQEIADELAFIGRRNPKVKSVRYLEFQRNAEMYKRWLAEGR